MKKCKHQFFQTTQTIDLPVDNTTITTGNRRGVKVMCAECGLQRILWDDGQMDEYKDGEWETL